MSNLYNFVRCFLLITVCFCTHIYAQTDTSKMPLPQLPAKQNAGFDVIVKKNGDIVYGLVTEVAPYLVYYKRTDIPDGPIYSMPRADVYAISYRNQVVDYIHPFNDTAAASAPGAVNPDNVNNMPYPHINYNEKNILQNGTVHIGIGFIRSFSKVSSANNYSSSGGMPVISLAYDVNVKDNLKVGLQVGFGSHKFSNQDYSIYDSTFNNLSLTEKVFGLYAYGKYSLLSSTSRIQPYITLGLGIATSHITSENRISFLNDDSKVLLVTSGARGASLNLMARAGASYYFSNQLQAFLDAGSGLSILNLGISLSVK